jgi:hypothetical protein
MVHVGNSKAVMGVKLKTNKGLCTTTTTTTTMYEALLFGVTGFWCLLL